MILNPYNQKDLLETIQGTRILLETFGLIGSRVFDPHSPLRIWTIQGLYAPIRGRALGGIRAKLVDQKDFVTFCNQRDLEVLIDLASPGGYCWWLDDLYVDFDDEKWVGLCSDEDDLLDDLYDREMGLRAQYPEGTMLPNGMTLERRVHEGPYSDYEESLMFLWDMDSQGYGPDPRHETVERRWTNYERTLMKDRSKLWHTVY